jgi:hypothetical protein
MTIKPGIPLAVTLSMFFLLSSCERRPALPAVSYADSLQIVRENLEYRHERSEFFLLSSESPFRRDTSAPFLGLRWYAVNPHWRVQSTLHRYDRPEQVDVLGTRGEKRQYTRHGYFTFSVPGPSGTPVSLKLNVYKISPADSVAYARYGKTLQVWFTDETSGKGSYGVGRYLDIGDESPDPDHVYTVDFNKAYNPYCAYTDLYSCAVPLKEDHLDLPVEVGEKNYREGH